MSLLESELNRKNVELAKNNPEIAKRRELEKKFNPIDPDEFAMYRQDAVHMKQIVLDEYGEEWELRVRKEDLPDGPVYTGTLKNKGEVEIIQNQAVLNRSEVEAEIDEKTFAFYDGHPAFPVNLEQFRGTIAPGLTVDFITGEKLPVIELETKSIEEREALLSLIKGKVVDRTGDKSLGKNYMAHAHNGFEHVYNAESLEQFAKRVVDEIIARYATGKNQVVTTLNGLPGSGKTTVTKMIQERITQLFGTKFTPMVVSTDDFHFGKKKLESIYGAPYTAWDEARTYNIPALAFNLEQLAEGYPFIKRHFDFETEEVIFDEEVAFSPFVIIEGLHAGSKDLENVRDLHFDLPTGRATSVGRDSRRLIIEDRANDAFPTPESRLKHYLEKILPQSLSLEHPGRNSYSASTRPLAERAFMLQMLNQ